MRGATTALVMATLWGCGGGATTPPPPPEDAGAVPTLTVEPGKLVPDFSPDASDYELTEYNALEPGTLTVTGATAAAMMGAPLENGVPAPLPKMAVADGGEAFDVTVDGRTYLVHLRPKELPTFSVTATDPEPGRLFLAPFHWSMSFEPSYLLVLDEEGRIVFYRHSSASLTDFKRQTLADGGVRYTYLSSAGEAHVLDEHFANLATLKLRPHGAHDVVDADLHDFILLGDEHWLLEAYVDTVVTNVPANLPQADGGAHVLAAVVQELDHGDVVFEWNSTEHPELYALSSEGNDFTNANGRPADYAHLNSLDLDPYDGDLVMSFRHLDAVLKVHRPDGATVWRLGGADDSFGTPPSRRPSHQHFARVVGPDVVRLFDNGNAAKATRISTYWLDPLHAGLVRYAEEPLPWYCFAMGSDTTLEGGSTLLGLGANVPGAPDVLELKPDGGEAFRLQFDRDDDFSYRAYKYP